MVYWQSRTYQPVCAATSELKKPVTLLIIRLNRTWSLTATRHHDHFWRRSLNGNGLDAIPVPISPGWDNAPFFLLSHFITKDPIPESRGMGNYRGMVKAPVVWDEPATELRTGGYMHWRREKPGKPTPVAVVIGARWLYLSQPCKGSRETRRAIGSGGLAGAPPNVTNVRR